ncbi:hypothetical protein CWE08_01055 [Aliidiomarina iranensis]|uniref:Lycopene cyclase n=1 Tax=Aliidiomarina iranensis TaxID=1434071 RepID=A0A432W222_9GAMM|nr:lycopene cyclase family protein [Aliidiomarina iranensis]RUO23272.1 hypothetical protein CWE08_01055 [Aliidiomarina iranensis]
MAEGNSKDNWLTIIGAGLAGLSLCDELLSVFEAANKPLPGKITLLEQRETLNDNKTFSFFAQHPPIGIPYTRYEKWCFSVADDVYPVKQSAPTARPPQQTHTGLRYQYYRVRGSDAYADLSARVSKHPQVEIIMGQAVENELITSTLVVDTRPCKLADMRVKQCFIGVEVELTSSIDESTAQLMSNMRMQSGRFTFDYVLPLDESRALVEVTQFCVDPPEQSELRGYLQATLQRLGVRTAPQREEMAILPMGLKEKFKQQLASQQIRTASGYGYLESKRWAKMNAELIVKGRAPRYQLHTPLLQWFDSKLLRVVETEPHKLPLVFMKMAEHMRPDDFASFMSSPNLSSLWQVMKAAPKTTFLRTLYA